MKAFLKNFKNKVAIHLMVSCYVCVAVVLSSSAAKATVTPQIAAGWNNTALLKSDGSVYTWGSNYKFQLGNGNGGLVDPSGVPCAVLSGTCLPVYSATPVAVQALRQGVKAISVGENHMVALTASGQVYAWGDNSSGQCGADFDPSTAGTQTTIAEPQVVQGINSAVAISAGAYHTVVLDSSGNVWTFGRNEYGQLGYGKSSSFTPVKVPNLTGIKAISAGGYHTVALKNDGTVWTWGSNTNGQLGVNTGLIGLPTVIPNFTDVKAIVAERFETIALKNDNTVWTFSRHGALDSEILPSQVPLGSDISLLYAGSQHSGVIKNDSTIWSWGYNNDGELGDGNTFSNQFPLQAVGMTDVVYAAGAYHTVVIKRDGTIWAWGLNNVGQLGLGYAGGENLLPKEVQATALNVNPGNLTITATAGAGGTIINGSLINIPSGGDVTLDFSAYAYDLLINQVWQRHNSSGFSNFTLNNVTTNKDVFVVFALPDGKIYDGKTISVADALKTLRLSVGLEPVTNEALAKADMNKDGNIDVTDVILILNKVVSKSIAVPQY